MQLLFCDGYRLRVLEDEILAIPFEVHDVDIFRAAIWTVVVGTTRQSQDLILSIEANARSGRPTIVFNLLNYGRMSRPQFENLNPADYRAASRAIVPIEVDYSVVDCAAAWAI